MENPPLLTTRIVRQTQKLFLTWQLMDANNFLLKTYQRSVSTQMVFMEAEIA